jgi:drug/metabolite transporter (DMT)-like permease
MITLYTNMQKPINDYLKLHFLVLIFCFTAILGNLIQTSSLAVVLYRTIIASTGFYLLLKYKKMEVKLPPQDQLKLLGIGIIMGIHWVCFFGSARLSNVSVGLVTFSTTSFFTSLIEPLINKKKPSWLEVIMGLFVIVGIYIIFKFEFKYIDGILVGLLGAVLTAIFMTFNSKVANRFEPFQTNFYELSGAFLGVLLCLPFLVPFANLQLKDFIPHGYDYLWLFILGIACTIYPYTQLIKLLKTISPFTVNLSINMEPIYGIILAYLIFGEKEKMGNEFYLGAGMILITIIIHPIVKNRQNKKPSKL